jgi:transcriptional regulator with XRE-family HTH domain
MTFTRAQCRAARALLNWSQEDLVVRAKITKKTIADFERGATRPRTQTLAQLVSAFETAGIEFLNGDRPGVRFRRKSRRTRSLVPSRQS